MTALRRSTRLLLVLATLTAVAACSNDGPEEGGSAGETTTTTLADRPDEPWVEMLEYIVEAGDGRENQSEGSQRAQERLVEELEAIAEPLPGGDGFLHAFDQGTNVLGFVEGTETPDEVVVLGAHYDHLGHDCDSDDPDDEVCDGASDNASGVAAVLEIGRRLAEDPPARSVVLALWDAEEDDKLGSLAAIESGVLGDSVVAYLNWDMQGTNLLPALADTTIIVGAETGGPALENAVATGVSSTDLVPAVLSLAFGQGRSDHASFVGASVPSVFFTDATSACYHTAQDDLAHLDFGKLARQIDLGETVTRAVAGSAARPTFVANAPATSFADAEAVLALVQRAAADLDGYPEDDRADVEQFLADLEAMVAAGETAFDDDAASTLATGTAALVELFTEGDCDDLLTG